MMLSQHCQAALAVCVLLRPRQGREWEKTKEILIFVAFAKLAENGYLVCFISFLQRRRAQGEGKSAVLVDGALAWSTFAIDHTLFGSCFLHFSFLVRVSVAGNALVLDG